MRAKSTSRAKSALCAEKRLHKTCDQMEMLQSRITELCARQKRATQRSRLAAAESLRLQLSVMEGMYAMYYTYAETQCQQLLQCQTEQ